MFKKIKSKIGEAKTERIAKKYAKSLENAAIWSMIEDEKIAMHYEKLVKYYGAILEKRIGKEIDR